MRRRYGDWLEELSSFHTLSHLSSSQVFEAVTYWMSEDPRRIETLPDLLSHVRLTQLPPQYILDTVMNHPLIKVSTVESIGDCFEGLL